MFMYIQRFEVTDCENWPIRQSCCYTGSECSECDLEVYVRELMGHFRGHQGWHMNVAVNKEAFPQNK